MPDGPQCSVCLFFSCAPRSLFRKLTQETGFQRPSFAGGVLSHLARLAEQMSSATLRGACGRTAPKLFFSFVFRIYRVPETISPPTHPVRIIHLGGSCLWLIPSGVKWQAGSSGGAEQVSDTPGRRWRAKDSCAARSWWWATRSVARRRSSTSLPRTRIQRWGGFIQLRRGFRVTHGSHWN